MKLIKFYHQLILFFLPLSLSAQDWVQVDLYLMNRHIQTAYTLTMEDLCKPTQRLAYQISSKSIEILKNINLELETIKEQGNKLNQDYEPVRLVLKLIDGFQDSTFVSISYLNNLIVINKIAYEYDVSNFIKILSPLFPINDSSWYTTPKVDKIDMIQEEDHHIFSEHLDGYIVQFKSDLEDYLQQKLKDALDKAIFEKLISELEFTVEIKVDVESKELVNIKYIEGFLNGLETELEEEDIQKILNIIKQNIEVESIENPFNRLTKGTIIRRYIIL